MLTVSVRLVALTVLEEAVVLAPLDKNAIVEHASVIVDAQDLNADLIDVELLVETASQDKHASQENVPELVLLNAPDLMEPKEHADGIDAEDVVEVAQLDTDAAMELASATPIVRTNIVVMMDVEEVVEPVQTVLFARDPLIPILNNATTTATLKSVLKFENSRPIFWLVRPVELISLDL